VLLQQEKERGASARLGSGDAKIQPNELALCREGERRMAILGKTPQQSYLSSKKKKKRGMRKKEA